MSKQGLGLPAYALVLPLAPGLPEAPPAVKASEVSVLHGHLVNELAPGFCAVSSGVIWFLCSIIGPGVLKVELQWGQGVHGRRGADVSRLPPDSVGVLLAVLILDVVLQEVCVGEGRVTVWTGVELQCVWKKERDRETERANESQMYQPPQPPLQALQQIAGTVGVL